MTGKQRHTLFLLMRAAWALARLGATRFGGSPALYFPCALSLVWRDRKSPARPVFRKGLGLQMSLPGMPQLEVVVRGQGCLPGMGVR